MKTSKARWTKIIWLLGAVLLAGLLLPAAQAADPDPVAELQAYLNGLNTEPARVAKAVEAIKEALGNGADPVAVRELVRLMAQERASTETAQLVCERVRTMTEQRVNLGEVVRELHLALGQGGGLEPALEQAENRVQAQQQYQTQTQTETQTETKESKGDSEPASGGGGKESGGTDGGKGSGKE